MEALEDEKRRSKISQDFGKNLFQLRKQKGFTREELAEKSNLSANYIYGLENGTYLPGCIALIDLSNALGVTTTHLLNEYIYNKQDVLMEKISQNINTLSNRDIELIMTIIDFCSKK